MAENTKSPVFSSPSYWVALGAGVVGIAAAAMQERKGSGSMARSSFQSGDRFEWRSDLTMDGRPLSMKGAMSDSGVHSMDEFRDLIHRKMGTARGAYDYIYVGVERTPGSVPEYNRKPYGGTSVASAMKAAHALAKDGGRPVFFETTPGRSGYGTRYVDERGFGEMLLLADSENPLPPAWHGSKGSRARGVTEDYVEEYLDGDNIAISTFLNRRLRGKAKSYAGQYARRLKAALDAMVVSGDAYRDTTPNGAVSYRRTSTGSRAWSGRTGSGSAAYRPYTSYGGDPYWMNAKYAGTDAKGLAFKKGERVFYYPKTKTIYAGANAETAYHDFRSMAEDEDFMGGGGSYNEGSAARQERRGDVKWKVISYELSFEQNKHGDPVRGPGGRPKMKITDEYVLGSEYLPENPTRKEIVSKLGAYGTPDLMVIASKTGDVIEVEHRYMPRSRLTRPFVRLERTGSGSAARVSDDRAYREAFNQAVDMANRFQQDVGLRRNALGGYSVYLFTEAERYSHRGQVVRPGEPKMGTGSRAMSGRQS